MSKTNGRAYGQNTMPPLPERVLRYLMGMGIFGFLLWLFFVSL